MNPNADLYTNKKINTYLSHFEQIYLWNTLSSHIEVTLLEDILIWCYYTTLWYNTLTWHFCNIFLFIIFVKQGYLTFSFDIFLNYFVLNTLVKYFLFNTFIGTLTEHTYKIYLWNILTKHF